MCLTTKSQKSQKSPKSQANDGKTPKKGKCISTDAIVGSWAEKEKALLAQLAENKKKQEEEEGEKLLKQAEVEQAKKQQYREANILSKKFDLLADALIAL